MIPCWQRKNHLHLYWIRWLLQAEKKAISIHHRAMQSNNAEWRWIKTFLLCLHYCRPIWRKLHLAHIPFASGARKRRRPTLTIGQIVRENDARHILDGCRRWTRSLISLFCFLFIRFSMPNVFIHRNVPSSNDTPVRVDHWHHASKNRSSS